MSDVDIIMAAKMDRLERDLRATTKRLEKFAAEVGAAGKMAGEKFEEGASRNIESFTRSVGASDRFMKQLFGTASLGKSAMTGVAASIALAAKATEEYAKVNEFAASSVKRLKDESFGLYNDIARDVSPLVGDAAGTVAATRRRRSSAVDFVVDHPGKAALYGLLPVAALSYDAGDSIGTRLFGPVEDGSAPTQSQQVTAALKAQEEATARRLAQEAVASARRESLPGVLAAQGRRLDAVDAQIREARTLATQLAAQQITGYGPEQSALRTQFIEAKLAPLMSQRTALLKDLAMQRFAGGLDEVGAGRMSQSRAADLDAQLRYDRLGVEAQEARLRGVSAESEKVRAIADAEEKIRKIRLQTFDLPAGADRRLETSVRETLQRQIDVIEQNDLNRRLADKVERNTRDRSMSSALRLEEQMTKAQEMRLRGRDREAEQLEIQAQFEKRIRDVVDTDFSSPGEANRYRGRLRMLMGDQLRMLGMQPPDRTASIGPGGYSAGIGRVAFGNGLGPGAAGSGAEVELKKANRTLSEIARKIEHHSLSGSRFE